MNIIKKEIDWCGEKLSFETGRIARQADGAVFVNYGETSVLCTVVARKEPAENLGFFPLTVHYKEYTFAAGKIPGGFHKREAKPSEKETLTSRLIDRPIRPLFAKGFHNEVQVICTVLSYDKENDSDVIAMIGASAALAISGIPFEGPIAAIRVGMIDGSVVLNPKVTDYEKSDLDLIVAGSKDSVLMVEAGAKELSEEAMLDAIKKGHEGFQDVLSLIDDFKKEVNPTLWTFDPAEENKELQKLVKSNTEKDLVKAYKEKCKQSRNTKIAEIQKSLLDGLDSETHSAAEAKTYFKKIQETIVRGNIFDKKERIDGRDLASVRNISTEVSMLNRAHGSALFTRGETQAIVVTTLGSAQDEQIVDTLDSNGKERFLLHYNFPPYSVGEVTMLRPPGRREIGHGKLAYRAIENMLPSKEEFPYTLRVVSEITESNGSSSMATICGASLALMDAGVPIKKSVAGIAMGLIKDGDKIAILSDILADEDHFGDMDFKVAGTQEGVTALQMDIKTSGINHEIMEAALSQAKEGRLHILGEMAKSLTSHRDSVNKHAPSIITLSIPQDKIGAIVGPGGKTIKDICAKTDAKIDIDDSGMVSIAAVDTNNGAKAKEMIESIVHGVKLNQKYPGTVTKILEFGAVVSFSGNEGLVHISEISEEKTEKVEDALTVGDSVIVKVIEVDDRQRKIRLTLRDRPDVDASAARRHAPRDGDRYRGGREGSDKDRAGRSGGGGYRGRDSSSDSRGGYRGSRDSSSDSRGGGRSDSGGYRGRDSSSGSRGGERSDSGGYRGRDSSSDSRSGGRSYAKEGGDSNGRGRPRNRDGDAPRSRSGDGNSIAKKVKKYFNL